MTIRRVDINFDPEDGSFLLQLRKADVALKEEPVQFQGKTFQPKEEVHITIIGSALGEALVERFRDDPDLVPAVRAAIRETGWSYRLKEQWFHVVREEGVDGKGYAESIIRMVDVPALGRFYQRLQSLTGLAPEPRPTHVTLYTYADAHGIGVATWREFETRVTEEVTPEALAPAR